MINITWERWQKGDSHHELTTLGLRGQIGDMHGSLHTFATFHIRSRVHIPTIVHQHLERAFEWEHAFKLQARQEGSTCGVIFTQTATRWESYGLGLCGIPGSY